MHWMNLTMQHDWKERSEEKVGGERGGETESQKGDEGFVSDAVHETI